MSRHAPIDVVLVDPDPASVPRMEALLKDEVDPPLHVLHVTGVVDALEMVTRGVGAVLLEGTHPETPAPEMVRRLVGAVPEVPVLVFGAAPDSAAALAEAGARVVVASEPFRGAKLAQAIRSSVEEKEVGRTLPRRDEVLSAQDAAFRIAFEHAPTGMALLDADGAWLHVNLSMCRILGFRERELRGMRWNELTHPDDLELALSERRRLLAGEASSVNLDIRCLHRNGHTLWIECKAAALRESDGAPLLFVLQAQDITARKRREAGTELLVDAAQLLMGSLDVEQAVRTLARLSVPRLADCVVVGLREGAGLVIPVVAAADPAKEKLLAEMKRRYPSAQVPATSPLGRVLDTGRSQLWPSINRNHLLNSAQDDEHREMLEKLGPVSLIMVPLTARGRIHGVAMLAAAESGHHYTREDVRIVEDLAHIAALAIDRGRRAREELSPQRPADDTESYGATPPNPSRAAATPERAEPGAPSVDSAGSAGEGSSTDLLRQLTDQERRVLTLAARGFPSADIARQMCLSPRTVETYRSRAMRKLGLENRAELIALAVRAGILIS
jgi:PAS domain S-box-containing protein